MKHRAVTESETISVVFINDVQEANIWILPQTRENMRTTLWGTPTFSKMKAGEKRDCRVGDEGTGKYLIRIIDTDGAYYAAGDVTLRDGYTIRFLPETRDGRIDILDGALNLVWSKENAFVGMLGAK